MTVAPVACTRSPAPGGDFTGIQPENRAGAASATSSRQATASERSGVFWKFQKSQMKQGSRPAGAAAHQSSPESEHQGHISQFNHI